MSDGLEDKIQKRLKEELLALPQPASREQIEARTLAVIKEEMALVNVPPALLELALSIANVKKT